jgi:multidrug efflux pump subunit AcrA (membrane-fusion protein)
LLWFIFGTGVYNLTVPCTVAPRQLRHVSAPNDGVLVATSVIAGDTVRRGDVLAELDRRELEQERAVLRARLAVLEHEQDRARAEESPVEVQLALAQATLTRAQLDIVESKIRRAVIRAPIDGVIVAGDLRPRIGGVLAQGDPMFAVAPHEGWTVELEVPEADADELTDGLTGGFSPYARPEQAQALRINRVRPTAEVPNDKNVFIAEADVDHLPFTWMRPGMEGTAKIHVGERPIWWLVLHRGIDFVRLHLWL